MKTADREVATNIIKSLLAVAKLQTMKEKYEQLRTGQDGVIRTTLSVVGTETGRLSSSGSFLEHSTNLQNQPKKVAMLDPLYNTRRCFVPRKGYVFIEGDLKAAEAFATAAYSADDELLERMHSGENIHTWTAHHIFRIPIEQIDKRRYQLGKVSRHALNYGMGYDFEVWRPLQRQQTFYNEVNGDADLTGITISHDEAREIVYGYHDLTQSLPPWWKSIKTILANKGYLINVYGRRRDFFGRQGNHATLKEAIAYLPQSTIADHLNHRLLALFEKEQRVGFEMLLQIHDAILVQCPQKNAKRVAAIMKATLEHEIEINYRKVLIPAEISVGGNWAEMETVI